MKTTILFTAISLAISNVTQASEQQLTSSIWQSVQHKSSATMSRNMLSPSAPEFRLDIQALTALSSQQKTQIDVPLPNGKFITFELSPSGVMPAQLASQYPQIKTFTGVQIGQPHNTGRFDITPQGFHAMFNQGKQTVFIDPSYRQNNQLYSSYFRTEALPLTQGLKRLPPRKKAATTHLEHKSKARNQAQQQKRYTIAVSATAEYTQFHGGTKASGLAAIVTMINRINQVYAQDMNLQFQLVNNNDSIIFTDAATDPFENTDADIDKNAEVINQAIGEANYDIGHVVGTGGGGLAGFGVVCTSAKAEGVTGSPQPTNDAFYIDFVAHEIGHQLMADHTFNGTTDSCEGNRAENSAYEPGSASSIMGYAGICGEQDLQSNSDPFFHIHSLDQMRAFVDNGDGKNCGTFISTSNNAPAVNAGSDYTIPARTAFTLTGSATDQDGDNLSYSWEQYDLGPATNSAQEDATDRGQGPLFRVWPATSDASRTLPRLTNLLAGTLSKGEALPTTSRDLNFRLVVRDGKGGTTSDAMKVTVVANQQGFEVTEPASGVSWNGSQQAVSWNTASSEQAPVSCNQVNISLSTDSGQTFNQNLAQNVANNGQFEVSLPQLNTDKARLKISCSNNIFFAISKGDFNINSDGSAIVTKPEFSNQSSLSVDEDQTLTLKAADFSFSDGRGVDSIQLLPGNNYQLQGLTVTPNANFNGELTVAVTAKRGELTSDPFNAKITVNAINDLPQATNDSATVEQDSSNNLIAVLDNDSDIDGDTLSLGEISYAGTGTVTNSNNQISYTPATGFNGSESLSYQVNDGNGGMSSATLTITVNQAPSTGTPGTPGTSGTPGSQGQSNSSGGGSLFYLLLTSGLLLLKRRKRSI